LVEIRDGAAIHRSLSDGSDWLAGSLPVDGGNAADTKGTRAKEV
jgi:hypothetical protein